VHVLTALVVLQVLVLEHLSGGETLKQLQRLKRYTEANACQMFKQVRARARLQPLLQQHI
jgi:hypothetical protein